MATLRFRLSRKDPEGHNTVYLETGSDVVMRPDGSTVEDSLSNIIAQVTNITETGVSPTAHAATHATGGEDPITPLHIGAADRNHSHDGYAVVDHTHTEYAPTSHTHQAQTSVSGNAGTATKLATPRSIRVNLASTSAVNFDGSANITPGVTGVLPVANGGTGASSLPNLKEELGIASGSMEVIMQPDVGSIVKWAGYRWIVVHKAGTVFTLALQDIYENCIFNNDLEATAYSGSNLAARAMAFQNSLPADAVSKAVNTNVNGVTAKIFVASLQQMNGGFSYFNDNASRIAYYNGNAHGYWTSSPGLNGGLTCINEQGGILNSDKYGNPLRPTGTSGFRPFVTIQT